MHVRRISDEVYVADHAVVTADLQTVEWLKRRAVGAQRRRARLCAHRDVADPLHEMLIALGAATYVRPHRHWGKTESFHVVEGLLTVVLFSDDGRVQQSIRLGDYASARPFFYRLADPLYHTVLVESPTAVIHETTNGPFDRTATEYASWAPSEEDAAAGLLYLRRLAEPAADASAAFLLSPAEAHGAKSG